MALHGNEFAICPLYTGYPAALMMIGCETGRENRLHSLHKPESGFQDLPVSVNFPDMNFAIGYGFKRTTIVNSCEGMLTTTFAVISDIHCSRRMI